MLLCSIKFQWFCRQNFLKILFTLETFTSLSSALAINPDIAKLVSGASPSIWRAKLTMPSAVSLGSWVFRSFVPIWRTTLSGFFLRRGLTKSSISSVVAPGKDLTTSLLPLEILQPRICWMIESPAITVTGFLACSLLLLAPECESSPFDDDLVLLELLLLRHVFCWVDQLPCSALGSSETGCAEDLSPYEHLFLSSWFEERFWKNLSSLRYFKHVLLSELVFQHANFIL